MDVRVVCISRAIAAAGETVGSRVAELLGYRYVDEQIITLAARQAQVDPSFVAAAEQRQPLLARIVDKLLGAREFADAMTFAAGVPVDDFGGPAAYRAVPEEMRVMIRAAIHEVARAGQTVIVAHAASMALVGVEGVLRVLVTAPEEVRAKRHAAEKGVDQAAADEAVQTSDRERRDYLKRFYGVKEELPTHYDLVINTEVLSPDQAAAVIVAAARGG
jgi:cytidylate kinase